MITAVDVFPQHLFAYLVTGITSRAVFRVIIDFLCNYTHLPTTLITDFGTQVNAQVIYKVAAVFGVDLKHATMKQVQTIGFLEKTHASVKAHLEAATGEFRNTWHRFSPWQSSTTTQRTMLHSIVNRQDFSMVVYHITYSIINSDIILILDISHKPMSLKQSNEECK